MEHAGVERAHKHRLGTKTLLNISWVLILFGAGWTIGSALWAFQTWRFVARADTASGVVIGNVSNGSVRCPQIRFQTRDGNNQVFTDKDSCSNPPRYQVDSVVTVIYDPNAPDHAAIPSFDALWLGQVVMGVMGIVALIIGIECLRVRQRRLPSEAHVRPSGSPTLVYPWMTMIAGIIMILVTIPWTINKRRFVAAAARAPGVVIAQVFHPATGRYSRSEYCPKIQFRTQTGNDVVVEDTTGCDKPPAFPVNMPVTILYDPAHPQDATIESFRTLWLAEIGLASVGLVISLLGFLWYRSASKR